jgi:hypothetical protein
MRALVLAGLVALGGCIIDNDPVRVENFTAETPTTFTYDAWTNMVMTENDDGAAEQIRRDWLAETLAAHGTCAAGYVVETRHFEQPWEGPFGNGGDIVYSGRCLCSAPEAPARDRPSAAFGGAPALDERPRSAMDRVARGQRDRGNLRQRARDPRRQDCAYRGLLRSSLS